MLRIVLTAPATEMSEYNKNPAIAFGAGFSKPWFIPREYLLRNFYKPVPSEREYCVRFAPLGLRRIEAALIESGIVGADHVCVVHPDNLEEVVSNDTRVVGISTKDPLGLGYVSTTYSLLLGLGRPINAFEFENLMKKIGKLKRRYGFRVVVGGPGVWQIVRMGLRGRYGIDVIVDGEGELIAPRVFSDVLAGRPVEGVVRGPPPNVSEIPPIRGATIYGAVEITRGCGRGCNFCTPTMQRLRSFPLDLILRDVDVNLRNGQDRVLLVTEDLFLYGASVPWEPNENAVKRLFEGILTFRRRGLKYIQVTHLNLAAAYYKRDLTKWVAEKLVEHAWLELRGKPIAAVEVGIETGSPRLLRRYMAGKPKPYTPEEWPEVVIKSLTYMEEHDLVALATIIVGLPDETEEDAYATLKLVESIRSAGLRTFLVPLLFIPLEHCVLRNKPAKTFDELTEAQLEVFAECWKHSIRVWGADHFKNYRAFKKLAFKLLSAVYMRTVARKYRWRQRIASEIYHELQNII